MRIYPSARSTPTPAITRVQRSRPYADYRLLDEHDPLVHSGADEQRRHSAAVDAAQSVAVLMLRIAGLKGALERGAIAFRRNELSSSEAEHRCIHPLIDKLNDCLLVFDEHPALRRSWRQALIEPFTPPHIQQCGIVLDEHFLVYESSDTHSNRRDNRLSKRERGGQEVMNAVFGRHGAASALRLVIESLERSPASALLDSDVLTQLHSTVGTVYSPFMRMQALQRVSLLLSVKG
ncbi:hypothetical protein [Paenibacillus kobensis]|uniref:hypothetical protein n=1 Tax=Paenibacillus kobensis TaxID=59841 RepID=UPI000FDB3FC5|nr:hypothetical protein [Paenibacillus kobensis]